MVYWSLSTKAKPEDLPLPLNASSSDQSATPSNPGAKSLAAVWASKYVKAIAPLGLLRISAKRAKRKWG
ncbi:MAG: hypothetical protein HC769_04130 [Cyanobacteria bacterium CRU_2_1]|nr:hypothetical protein [Cyanobacteria bacterium CRU_2_1]